jgi:amino acid transporter
MCAGEAVQPRKAIPRATKAVVLRLSVFFVLGTIAMGVLVPYNDPMLIEAVNTGVGSK